MTSFLDKFPLVRYSIDKKLLNEYDTVRNLLFRVRILKEVMDMNMDTYYLYTIKDGESPDDLADKVYGTSTAHWVILYANNIYDPYYDWPLSNSDLDKYIAKKYGSIEWAQTNYHHFEKVITRENPYFQKSTVTKFEVNEKKLTDGILTLFDYTTNFNLGEIAFAGPSNAANIFSGEVISWSNSNGRIVLANTNGKIAPYQFLKGLTSSANGTVLRIESPSAPMDAYNTLVDTTDFISYNVASKTVFETTSRDRVSYYDYELNLNESKRQIKIIHPRYYTQIVNELDQLINMPPSYFRRPI